MPVGKFAAHSQEIIGVRSGLHLQDAVNGGDQVDEIGDGLVALRRCQLRVFALPFQLVEDRVLRLLLPVEQEYVLSQLGEVGVGLDALRNRPKEVSIALQIDDYSQLFGFM